MESPSSQTLFCLSICGLGRGGGLFSVCLFVFSSFFSPLFLFPPVYVDFSFCVGSILHFSVGGLIPDCLESHVTD